MESSKLSRRRVLQSLGAAATIPALSGVAGAQSTDQSEYGPIGRVEVEGTTEAIVSGDTVFLATTDGFATVDVSDSESPTVLAEERGLLADREGGPLGQIYDVKVEGDRLLVAGPANGGSINALVFYDVSDPANPEQVSVYETESANHNVFLSDGVAYHPRNFAGGFRGGNPVVMVDADSGEELGRWSLTDADEAWGEVSAYFQVLHDMYVQDGVAYLAYWDAGTWMLDVSDPSSPSLVGKVRGRPPEELADAGQAEYTEPPGNDHYVAVNEDASLLGVGSESWDANPQTDAGGPSGIELFDISDPTTPESLATITPPATDQPTSSGVWTTSHNFEFAADRLYTSWYRGGVKVFDITDPASPGILREWEDREEASFWTAQVVERGETFVASAEDHNDNGFFNGLMVFPDAPADERSTRTQTPQPTDTPADSPTSDDPTSTDVETTAETTENSSGSGPGFGVAAGVAGTGLAAWRLLRNRDESE